MCLCLCGNGKLLLKHLIYLENPIRLTMSNLAAHDKVNKAIWRSPGHLCWKTPAQFSPGLSAVLPLKADNREGQQASSYRLLLLAECRTSQRALSKATSPWSHLYLIWAIVLGLPVWDPAHSHLPISKFLTEDSVLGLRVATAVRIVECNVKEKRPMRGQRKKGLRSKTISRFPSLSLRKGRVCLKHTLYLF